MNPPRFEIVLGSTGAAAPTFVKVLGVDLTRHLMVRRIEITAGVNEFTAAKLDCWVDRVLVHPERFEIPEEQLRVIADANGFDLVPKETA